MESKLTKLFNSAMIWIITTAIFAFGILTFNYWLNHNNLNMVVNISCFIVAAFVITHPVYTYWERKVKSFFNQLDNE